MDKFTFKTADGINVNIEKLSQAFPEVITETVGEDGKIKRVADFEKLKMLLGDSAAERPQEFYEFTWPGKNEAIFEAAKATTKTLRPCPEESKNWDTTQNLYIEGDNLEALKILQEAYLGKVKMIYIDPPYNTGKDFVYRDNFHKSAEEGKEDETVRDEETDNNLFQNTESNGRFHSDWCSMIYPRLKLARDLLRDDGVIFISIDDNEVHNLRKICDEIFGESNFWSNFVWDATNKAMNAGDAKYKIQNCTESILVYGKKAMAQHSPLRLDSKGLKEYKNKNERGYFRLEEIQQRKNIGIKRSEKMYFPILNQFPRDGYRWTIGEETARELERNDDVVLINNKVTRKIYENTEANESFFPLWNDISDTCGTSENGKAELNTIVENNGFETVKPMSLIKKILYHVTLLNDIILDFFSGSATTAHACMQLNAEDGGNRKFIMVQLPEVCAPDSEAAKAGYKNICEIGKERIRRAGEKIKAEHATTAPNLDIGFRVLKIDESIMKDVFYSPNETSQDLLSTLESNIKEDRTDLDLLFACLVDWGVELSMPLKTEEINGIKVYTVNDSENPDLIASFSENIPEATIREIAKRKPLRIIFRDSSFADSPSKINVTEIFKNFSPNTTIKVL